MGHWEFFTRFAEAELDVGGPDAQLALIARHWHNRGHSPTHGVWLAGCYCAHHTAPSGYALYEEFHRPIDVIWHPKRLTRWLETYWDDLPLRREMRSHRMLEKRHACITDFARYALNGQWANQSYEEVWNDSIKHVRFYNRYMALKFLELLRLTVRPDLQLRDLRAKHAWSPRIALAWLYPKHAEVLLERKDNSPSTIALTERLAASLYRTMRESYRIKLNYFQLQVLLCNYKQTTLGRFYPGMGLDEELEYMQQAAGVTSMRPLYRLRRELYHPEDLGEVQGWTGIRPAQLQRWKHKGARHV